MALVRCVTAMGMGVDVHGLDDTLAAQRAVFDAMHPSSLGCARLVGATADEMIVNVTIGAPRPDKVQVDEVVASLPHGRANVPVVVGGLARLNEDGRDGTRIDPTHRPGAGPIGIDQQLGWRSLTFVVTNLDEVIQRLEAAHIAFTRPKTTIRPGTTIAMVQDPDGNIVECVERG
jgi:uncharacterized protein (TIGR02058 family)